MNVLREQLQGPADPLDAARWLKGDERPVALSGSWAGGGLILTSHPVRRAASDEDPFALLDDQPAVAGDGIGGGWFGWWGFQLARRLEPVPPPPPRPHPLPDFDLAFHDHLVRCDADGRWWFEALLTGEREAFIAERRALWRERLTRTPPRSAPTHLGAFAVGGPGLAGHAAAVDDTIERIAAGEIFQANICLRLDATADGDLHPLDVWIDRTQQLEPAYAAYVGHEDHAIASLSPELFLRRSGRHVITEPIKGTAPLSADPAALQRSVKDRAENVMIVDLMRNDLGRVAEYGSVHASLFETRKAPGVWHLVSTVEATLTDTATDADLLRATFPPGSVTGAPKVQALKVIHELEPTAREAYCGAIGFAARDHLELNVAIRTLEFCDGHVWLGAGGGIVSDSTPAAEVDEALTKARGLNVATTGHGDAPRPLPAPIVTLPRPDPARGILETILVCDGEPQHLEQHLRRLHDSCKRFGLKPQLLELPDIDEGRIRIVVDHTGTYVSTGALPQPALKTLTLHVLPGGLGPHKWADRTLIDALTTATTTPLFCDLDGTILEAGYAAFHIVENGRLITPPQDGRILPSVSRLQTDAQEEPITLARAQAADAILLSSALRGLHPAHLPGAAVSR